MVFPNTLKALDRKPFTANPNTQSITCKPLLKQSADMLKVTNIQRLRNTWLRKQSPVLGYTRILENHVPWK